MTKNNLFAKWSGNTPKFNFHYIFLRTFLLFTKETFYFLFFGLIDYLRVVMRNTRCIITGRYFSLPTHNEKELYQCYWSDVFYILFIVAAVLIFFGFVLLTFVIVKATLFIYSLINFDHFIVQGLWYIFLLVRFALLLLIEFLALLI